MISELIFGITTTSIIFLLVYMIDLMAKKIINKPLKTNNRKIDPPQELKNPKIEIALLLEHNIKIGSFRLSPQAISKIDPYFELIQFRDLDSTYTPSDQFLKGWFPWLDRLDKELKNGIINPQQYQDKIAPHLDIVNEIKADQTKHRQKYEYLYEERMKTNQENFENFLWKNKHKLIDLASIQGIVLKDGRLDLTNIVKYTYFDRIDKTKDFTVENSILIRE